MNVLAVGPNKNPVTGQSKCFNYFVCNSGHNVIELNTTGKGRFYFLRYILLVVYHRIFSSYDVIYFTSSRTKFGFIRDLILVLFNFNHRFKIVNHLHGADFSSFLNELSPSFRSLVDLIYRRINVSIVLTPSMRKQYAEYPLMEVVVIPNFYDSSEVGEINSVVETKPLKVLFLSNLIASKGYMELIEAFKVLGGKYIGKIELHIAGALFDGDMTAFESIINEIDSVHFHGVANSEVKAELLSQCHILALPTYYPTEAQPLCLIEGMASGCYIVTTNHNYIPEFVSSANGSVIELINNDCKVELSKALIAEFEALIYNYEEVNNIMLKNVEYASQHFGGSVFIRSIDKVLEEGQ